MIKTLLITRDKNISNEIFNFLTNKKNHNLEIASIEELVEREEIICDIIIYSIEKKEKQPFEILKVLSENVPVIVLLNGEKLKNSNETSIKLIQNGAKTILYNIKEDTLVYSIERIYELEYNQSNLKQRKQQN